MTDDQDKNDEKKKAQIIKASTMLQAKVGLGPLNEKAVVRAQEVLDNNNVDFTTLAREYLRNLEINIAALRESPTTQNRSAQPLTEPVMQLKAHASMFGYPLVGTLANIMLSFLENVKQVDNDVIDIADAHLQTLKMIVAKKMSGPGGEYGKILEQELNLACKRYFTKKQ